MIFGNNQAGNGIGLAQPQFNLSAGASTTPSQNKLLEFLLGTPATDEQLQKQYNPSLYNYQQGLKAQGFDDATVNGVSQGLNSGNADIAQFIDANNIRKPQTEAEIAQARAGNFNSLLSNTNGLRPRVGGFLNDFASGYQENYNNGLNINNFGNNELPYGRQKGFGYRAGEFLGSVGRIADSPLGRGLIAAGLTKAMGSDNPLQEGLIAYVGRQQAKAGNDLYRNLLETQGIDTSNIGGNITDKMYDTVSKATNQRARIQNQMIIASLKDNTQRARMIGTWLRNGQITPDDAQNLVKAYGIEGADFQESDNTRKTNSQIALNDARIENIKNPKPKTSTVVHISKSEGGSGNPIGTGKSNNNSTVRVQAPDGTIKRIPKSQVDAAVKAGGKVL